MNAGLLNILLLRIDQTSVYNLIDVSCSEETTAYYHLLAVFSLLFWLKDPSVHPFVNLEQENKQFSVNKFW